MSSSSASAPAAAPAALKVLRRLDYRPLHWTIKTTDLSFSIHPPTVRVEAALGVVRRADPATAAGVSAEPPLILDRGDRAIQQILSVSLDGAELKEGAGYTLTEKHLTIPVPSDACARGSFAVRLVCELKPEENTSLEGLYKSGSAYITQCEAEGFRNICPYIDRPDNMSVYSVRLEAPKEGFPRLLSNGNPVESGDVAGSSDRHFVLWRDPFPKPCYIFAVVAGDLALSSDDSFTTMSGRKVALKVYTSHQNKGKTAWATESLKRAMRWDEIRFGREYYFDLLQMVAADDFNMGAMENSGLLVFVTRLIVASEATSSDADKGRIAGIVGHEYFHAFTGNRITCQNWFELSLKEGLTVYRDQEFSSDMESRPVKRIEDVSRLRVSQFGEDAGPTSHPIRPDEVAKMDNMYTATVYEKGAEVVRMYETLLTTAGFRRGMDHYFKTFDGQAVTCDDFWQAMHDGNVGHAPADVLEDLRALKVWYGQAGTPEVTVTPAYDAATKTLTLTATQRVPPTPGQTDKKPCLIPIVVGLVGPDGKDVPLSLRGSASSSSSSSSSSSASAPSAGSSSPLPTSVVLRLTTASHAWTFDSVPPNTVPSILRNFSAPVRLTVTGQTEKDLAFLLAHDSDPFNRWEAGQRLGKIALLSLYEKALPAARAAASSSSSSSSVSPSAIQAAVNSALAAGAGGILSTLSSSLSSLLADTAVDGAFLARAISLPSETEVVDHLAASAEHGKTADPLVVHFTREYVVTALAASLRPALVAAVERADKGLAEKEKAAGGQHTTDFPSVALRALRNKSLQYLACLGEGAVLDDILRRFTASDNMTDAINTLVALANQPVGCKQREEGLAAFAAKWKDEPLVLLKWFSLVASTCDVGTLEVVRSRLTAHPSFSFTNPSSVYMVLGGFTNAVPAFHNPDGSGYKFLAEMVRKLDGINPQVAARIVSYFTKYRMYDEPRQKLIRAELEWLGALGGKEGESKLSDNVGEIVARSLAI